MTFTTTPSPVLSTLPGGYRSAGRRSPLALGGALAVNLGIGLIIWMLPPALTDKLRPDILWTFPIPKDPPAPRSTTDHPDRNDARKHIVTPEPGVKTGTAQTGPVIPAGEPTQPAELGPKTSDTPDPVFVIARPDPRRMASFQPAYPASMIAAQKEGFATVRVAIDADGRVTAIDLVDASDPAFWQATRVQALRGWRFLPATRGGDPVSSERTLTVRFRLSDL